jgi:hypothetical protein
MQRPEKLQGSESAQHSALIRLEFPSKMHDGPVATQSCSQQKLPDATGASVFENEHNAACLVLVCSCVFFSSG